MQCANVATPSPLLFSCNNRNGICPGLFFSAPEINNPFHLQVLSLSSTSLKPASSGLLHCSSSGRRMSAFKCYSSSSSEDSLEINKEEEVQAIITGVLLEAGLSNDIASQISSTCPQYSKMLRDSVAELDESSLWTSWLENRTKLLGSSSDPNLEVEAERQDPLLQPLSQSYSQKLKLICMDKADNGRIPFLESVVGLSLPSATHMARLHSSQSLLSLLRKVKYIKDVVYMGSKGDHDQALLAGKLARQMMLHLSIRAIDDGLQRTLSFFEKMEARRGGLKRLGFEEASFRHLAESFPRLLLCQVEEVIKFLLVDVGIPEKYIGNILLLYPPIVFLDIEKDLRPQIQAYARFGITGKNFVRILRKYPWILSRSIQENYKEIVLFLEGQRVPRVYITRALRSLPLLHGCSTSKFHPMMEQLCEMKLKPHELGKIIATSPQLLLQKPLEYLKVVSFLQDAGLEEETIGKILIRCPELFAMNVEDSLMKKIEFITSVGIPRRHLPQVIRKYPELFVSDVSRTLVPRLNYLTNMGLSKRDVAQMIIQFSPILGYSIDKVLSPKFEYLIKTMGKPVTDVVGYPRYFSYSLEKKIKARHLLLLRVGNTTCSLKDMLGKNDEEFAVEYMDLLENASHS